MTNNHYPKKEIKKGNKAFINTETRNLKRHKARLLDKEDIKFLAKEERGKS